MQSKFYNKGGPNEPTKEIQLVLHELPPAQITTTAHISPYPRNLEWALAVMQGCTLQFHESQGTRLAADVDDIMLVGETVEGGGRALGVGTHVLKVQPVANIENLAEADALGDAINAVASGTPDAVLNGVLRSRLVSNNRVVHGTAASTEDLGHGVLVIEHDAAEVSVQTIVDIDHVAGVAVVHRSVVAHGRRGVGDRDSRAVLNSAASNDVAGKGECRGSVVATRLSDEVDAGMGREVLIEGSAQDAGHLLESIVAAEASTHIKSLEIVAISSGLLEDDMSVLDSLQESSGIRGARANVEADANHAETQLAGKAQETVGGVEGSAELQTETAKGRRIVGKDAEEELGVGIQARNLAQLIGVIEGHLAHALLGDIAHVGVGLARLCIDNAGGIDAHAENLLNLGLGGTVEAGAESGQKPQEPVVGVALDSWKKKSSKSAS